MICALNYSTVALDSSLFSGFCIAFTTYFTRKINISTGEKSWGIVFFFMCKCSGKKKKKNLLKIKNNLGMLFLFSVSTPPPLSVSAKREREIYINMYNVICPLFFFCCCWLARKIRVCNDLCWADQMIVWSGKNLKIVIFSAQYVINVKLCSKVLLTELYLLIPFLVTLTMFQC